LLARFLRFLADATLPKSMGNIGSINFGVSVDTAKLRAAIEDVRDAIQTLDAKLDALNEVDLPVEVGVRKDAAERMANTTRKAERLTAANRPSPSYRAAEPQASEM